MAYYGGEADGESGASEASRVRLPRNYIVVIHLRVSIDGWKGVLHNAKVGGTRQVSENGAKMK